MCEFFFSSFFRPGSRLFFCSYAKVQEKNADSLSFSFYLQNEENLYLLKFRLVHQLEDLMQRTHMGYALNNRPEQLADSAKLFPRFIFSSDEELQSSVVGRTRWAPYGACPASSAT